MTSSERHYLIKKVPDLSPTAWELLFNLVESGVSLDLSGECCDAFETARRRIFGKQLVDAGLAFFISNSNMLYATEAGHDVVEAFELAYETAKITSEQADLINTVGLSLYQTREP
jgi:hypothetical protein